MVYKVSIIINCFNGADFLEESLKSALSQDYKNIEVVFWDNVSIDDSFDIASSFAGDERLKLFSSPEHTSLSVARYEALKVASGDLVGFLDVDDLWDPFKVSRQVRAFNDKEMKPVFVSSLSRIIDGSDTVLLEKTCTPPKNNSVSDVLRFMNPFVFQTLIFDREKVLSVLKDSHFYYCPDYYLIFLLIEQGEFVHVDDVTVSYRVHDNNLSKALTVKKVLEPLRVVKFIFRNNEKRSEKIFPARVRLLFYLIYCGRYNKSVKYLIRINFFHGFFSIFKGFFYFFKFGLFLCKIRNRF